MLRKTLTILSLIGLLLSVGVLGMSYGNFFGYSSETMTWAASRGMLIRTETWTDAPPQWFWLRERVTAKPPVIWLPRIHHNYVDQYVLVLLPLWMPTVFFAGVTWFCYFPIHRRRKRKKLGLCVKCGYDLRGSKERCPECGTGFSN